MTDLLRRHIDKLYSGDLNERERASEAIGNALLDGSEPDDSIRVALMNLPVEGL